MSSHTCPRPKFCDCKMCRPGTGKVCLCLAMSLPLILFLKPQVHSGYAAPQNLQNYAIYLDSRIRAYHDLKHDAVRVQAESNRDLRNTNSIEEDGYRVRNSGGGSSKPSSSVPSRNKTITGRKLRVMTVEKGLLRETKAVHRMVDSLVECRVRIYTPSISRTGVGPTHVSYEILCSSTWMI